MLDRVAALREAGRIGLPHGVGVLVKAPKRRQDRRFDLPSIGPDTVARAARAGLAGIAVIAGATIVAEPQRLIEAADRAGLFVVGRSDREARAMNGAGRDRRSERARSNRGIEHLHHCGRRVGRSSRRPPDGGDRGHGAASP